MTAPLRDLALGTPAWVWCVLAGLVAVGLWQTRPQVLTRLRMTAQPIAAAVYALFAVVSQFGLQASVPIGWLAGLGAGLAFASLNGVRRPVRRLGGGRFLLRGSWVPLAIYLSIFAMRYAAATSLAMQPGLAGAAVFVGVVSAVYGLPIGMLTARALVTIDLAGRTPPTCAAPSTPGCSLNPR